MGIHSVEDGRSRGASHPHEALHSLGARRLLLSPSSILGGIRTQILLGLEGGVQGVPPPGETCTRKAARISRENPGHRCGQAIRGRSEIDMEQGS